MARQIRSPVLCLQSSGYESFCPAHSVHISVFAMHTIFSFGYGLFCFCTWAFLTFTLVCRHFCPSQKAQIPKSHKIVTLMLICHIYIRDFTVLPHNKYIWRFINLFLAWFFTASQKFSRLLWMYTTSHAADPLFQHYPVALDESHTDCVTLGGKR